MERGSEELILGRVSLGGLRFALMGIGDWENEKLKTKN